MSTSSRHNRGGVLNAIDTLHSYLSDPGSGTNKHANHRTLTQLIYEFKQQFQSMDHHGHSDSTHMMNNNDGDSSSTTNKIREMMNKAFDSISLSNPEEMDTRKPRCNLVDDDQLMQAYSYFFIMEDGAVIKKKDLIYWWVAQGVIKDNDGDGDGDAEAAASVLLQKLVHLKVVKRITCTERRKELCKYRAVKGMMINQEHQIRDGLQNVGMLKSQRKRSENSIKLINPNGETIDNEKSTIEMLYNRDVSFIDIPREWLPKRKSNLKVLQLGRWSGDNNNNPEKNHMEGVNLEILLKELKQLKKVRLISFRGVSGIMELGDEICSLGDNLRVLDLQACHNLEVLPKGIGNLVNLTHLDLSECYLLDRIPKGITSLTKLQVLEGFVVSDVVTSSSCKFKDLATHLGTTLKKLSIRTRNVSFPTEEEDLEAFAKFEKLLRLKVVWVQVSRIIDDDVKKDKEKQDGGEQKPSLMRKVTKQFRREANAVGLPKQLQKLEVQAIPQDVVKSLIWSSLDRLTQLKKLTIIGGHVFDLTNQGDIKWKMVETLQLKHLNNLCMNWREFKESFPQLIYLQKIGCPNLHFFPCDIAGIWRQS